jgi:2-methylcitrate dehydratase PrpD
MHACCQYAQSTVEATLSAMNGEEVDSRDVTALVVATHWKGRRLDRPRPETSLAAKFSIQHIASATLAYGHAGADAFSADSLTNAEMVRLRHLVEIEAYPDELPWPNDRPAHVSITLRDGRVLKGTCLSAPGGADNPFSAAQISRKILDNLIPAYPTGASSVKAILALAPDVMGAPWATTLSRITA